jgi:hypothetical protein
LRDLTFSAAAEVPVWPQIAGDHENVNINSLLGC